MNAIEILIITKNCRRSISCIFTLYIIHIIVFVPFGSHKLLKSDWLLNEIGTDLVFASNFFFFLRHKTRLYFQRGWYYIFKTVFIRVVFLCNFFVFLVLKKLYKHHRITWEYSKNEQMTTDLKSLWGPNDAKSVILIYKMHNIKMQEMRDPHRRQLFVPQGETHCTLMKRFLFSKDK